MTAERDALAELVVCCDMPSWDFERWQAAWAAARAVLAAQPDNDQTGDAVGIPASDASANNRSEPSPDPTAAPARCIIAACPDDPVRIGLCAHHLALIEGQAAQPESEPIVPAYRGYAALGTGQYAINHSRAGEPPELVITLATEDEKRGRQVGESRDNPPDAPPIQADEMIIRIAFTSERGLFALEDQLAWVRKVHFAEAAAPAQGEDASGLIVLEGRDTPLPEVWVVWGKAGVDFVAPLEYMAQEHANDAALDFPDEGPWRVHRYVLPVTAAPAQGTFDRDPASVPGTFDAAPAQGDPKCTRCDDTGCPVCDPEWAQHQAPPVAQPAEPPAPDLSMPSAWPGLVSEDRCDHLWQPRLAGDKICVRCHQTAPRKPAEPPATDDLVRLLHVASDGYSSVKHDGAAKMCHDAADAIAALRAMVNALLNAADCVLCDPDGRVCISGSNADRAIMQAAIDAARAGK